MAQFELHPEPLGDIQGHGEKESGTRWSCMNESGRITPEGSGAFGCWPASPGVIGGRCARQRHAPAVQLEGGGEQPVQQTGTRSRGSLNGVPSASYERAQGRLGNEPVPLRELAREGALYTLSMRSESVKRTVVTDKVSLNKPDLC